MYTMFAKNGGSGARLYDLQEDLHMNEDIVGIHQDILNNMWSEYVLKDAGGPLPRYLSIVVDLPGDVSSLRQRTVTPRRHS